MSYLTISEIKQLKIERKKELIALFENLRSLQKLTSEKEKQHMIHSLTIQKNKIEKYYFEKITKLLIENRDRLVKLLNKTADTQKNKKWEAELKRNDELAREFEAEIIQEKLLLSQYLGLSDSEINSMKKRLYELGYKVDF